jgi:hypothetical protein
MFNIPKCVSKPPIGIFPRWVWFRNRYNEIIRSINEYKEYWNHVGKKEDKEYIKYLNIELDFVIENLKELGYEIVDNKLIEVKNV